MSHHLPKGFPVTYRMPIPGETAAERKEKADSFASEKGITYAYLKDYSAIFISGFVAGDTDGDGISVVALDNTELCLCSRDRRSKSLFEVNTFRELLRRGCYTQDEQYGRIFSLLGSPVCQFS